MQKNQKRTILLLLIIELVIACSTLITDQKNSSEARSVKSTTQEYHFKDYLPTTNHTIYHHTYYSLSYNEEHEQADWVYYLLTKEFVNGTAKRKNNFKADSFITTKSASLNDYKKSGYDRGHLCAAADMKINEKAMSETFFMSNMSPQIPGFNRGEWKKLEAKVRDWAIKEDSIVIVTGPVFYDNITRIGENQVTVPGYYYKVIYDLTKPQKMTAFILPHISKPQPFLSYQTSVNKVEEFTGIDFFSTLEDKFEEQLEGNQHW